MEQLAISWAPAEAPHSPIYFGFAILIQRAIVRVPMFLSLTT
jgi:hypothetical protein